MGKPKLTPWFKPGTFPVRKGFYIASVAPRATFYRYWTGRQWLIGNDSLRKAIAEGTDRTPWWDQNCMHWRGLAEKP